MVDMDIRYTNISCCYSSLNLTYIFLFASSQTKVHVTHKMTRVSLGCTELGLISPTRHVVWIETHTKKINKCIRNCHLQNIVRLVQALMCYALIGYRPVVLFCLFFLSWALQRQKHMMTSSNGNNFRVTGPMWEHPPVTGGFPTQRPVTRGNKVFFHLRLSKRLSEQSRRRWFEMPSRSLWRRCNEPQ